MFPTLSKEAREALKDESPLKPPHSFYPMGYPTRSALHKLTQFKPYKKEDWAWKKRSER